MASAKHLFRKLYTIFSIPTEKINNKTFIIYILLAYTFGVIVRLMTFIQIYQIKIFWLEGKPVSIWTPDAGRYGYYAKKILLGHDLPFSADYLTGHLIACASSLFGISIEWVMLLLPIFITPLIVIPMMMIAKSIKQPTLGFLAALIAVSETYLYVRTSLGYMDTDGVNLFLILLAVAFIVKSTTQKNILYAILAALTLLLFSQWYHSASVINLSVLGITVLTVLIYYRKDIVAIQTVLLLSIAITPLSVEFKLINILLLGTSFILLDRYSRVTFKGYWLILGLGVITAAFFIDSGHYIHRVLTYFSTDAQLHFSGNGTTYFYTNDLLTVDEVGGSSLWRVGAAAPFHLTNIYILVGIIGYLVLLAYYSLIWFTLPLFILGLLSSFVGVRFSMYATPVLAMGVVYLFYVLRQYLLGKYKEAIYIIRLPYYASTLILLLMIYNLLAINIIAMSRIDIYAPEAKELKTLSKRLKKDDTMISWWDYGWPLWYYTGNKNTLVDNGKHGGPDTYIIARMLLSTDQTYVYNAANILAKNKKKATQNGSEFALQFLAKDHNLSKLFSPLLGEKILSEKKEDGNIYIILHYKMMDFFTVINDFSKKGFHGTLLDSPSMLRMTKVLKPFSETYSLFRGFSYILDSSDGTVLDTRGNKTPVKGLTIVQNNTRLKGYIFKHDSNSTNSQVIAYRNKFIWVDQTIYDSFYIQAMLFDVYDHDLFEKVGETGRIKIFRVKRDNE